MKVYDIVVNKQVGALVSDSVAKVEVSTTLALYRHSFYTVFDFNIG